jgi:hypothetical protein
MPFASGTMNECDSWSSCGFVQISAASNEVGSLVSFSRTLNLTEVPEIETTWISASIILLPQQLDHLASNMAVVFKLSGIFVFKN